MRAAALALGLPVLLAVGQRAHAEQAVLHEFVSGIDPDEGTLALTADSADPQAIVHDGDVLLPRERARADDDAMVATVGDGVGPELPGQRSPTFRPDRETRLEGMLGYQEAFNPAIAPFKRVTALDATRLDPDGVTPVLAIDDSKRAPVPIEGADAKAPDARPRDRFWGEAELDFGQGRVLPFPSVSPESRILTLRSEPALQLSIERDAADNFYAVARGPLPAGEVFVSFLTDAPRSYFGGELPAAAIGALASAVPPLEAGIRARGMRVAAELGITGRGTDLAGAITALTAHFRAFEESDEPPQDSGDIYLDLARGKRGICRHRAYAFVVTAHALGIPARFVQNEAHSWVEVKLPRLGYRRIDLGGAAHGLTTHGLSDRAFYQPAEPDRLPRPRAYEESYSLASRTAGNAGASEPAALQGRWVSPDLQGTVAAGAGLLAGLPSARASSGEGERSPLTLALERDRLSVRRGGPLQLRGHVRDAVGAGVQGLRIEVSLAAQNRRERMLLGVTVSAARGVFEGSFDVPPDLPVGEYQLVVITPGNERHLPAMAE